MVNNPKKDSDMNIEITNEETEPEDIELEDIESSESNKLKKLREKLNACEADKRAILDDLQRAKAEFLNAKKRLGDEREQDRTRAQIQHAQALLPLCDSFEMAMRDKEAWDKIDKAWRTGIEGIYMQLTKLLQSYNVKKIEALGQSFDPYRFEAVEVEPVDEPKQVDVVQRVLQDGYEMTLADDKKEVIRPARVVTGTEAVSND